MLRDWCAGYLAEGGAAALHFAAEYSAMYLEMLRVMHALLDTGACDVNARDVLLRTPLLLACEGFHCMGFDYYENFYEAEPDGYTLRLSLLLRLPELHVNARDRYGNTALKLCIETAQRGYFQDNDYSGLFYDARRIRMLLRWTPPPQKVPAKNTKAAASARPRRRAASDVARAPVPNAEQRAYSPSPCVVSRRSSSSKTANEEPVKKNGKRSRAPRVDVHLCPNILFGDPVRPLKPDDDHPATASDADGSDRE